ncbi:hypothetical protein PPTG_04502 [Phytophthora nicotianae INRA-310]|uniref:MtN3-like protein n=1 Tax=Phytophthora nicotianae (strain INRA-310) TaxID=761204 RepID=W2R2Z8_PHYN3|nr:hypothetical protein PPTG_04502 [Phytophthora nicotianae INRA-310]ETN19094.1 hypothetical protein PPTG_04502 [Phytophthora nicotianae INRA-310]
MSGWFSDVLNVAAAIAQVILSLSPAPDIYNVHRHKDIGEMAALPLVAMAVNNHACHSGVQPARAIMYSAIYFRWSSKPKRKELIKLFARAFALHCALSLYFVLGAVGVTGQTKSDVGTWFGYVGVVINVWITKNSASIPINLSVMLLISTLLWLGTGILDSDLFNAGINSVGATLSLIQIVVYFYYRSNRNDELLIQQDLISKEDDMSIVIATPKDNTTITPLDTSVYKPMASPRT